MGILDGEELDDSLEEFIDSNRTDHTEYHSMEKGEYHIAICKDNDGKALNVLIKESVITVKELIEPIKDKITLTKNDAIDHVDSYCYNRYGFEYFDVEFSKIKMDDFPHFKELLELKERYERDVSALKKENDELKKRNAYLECELYRGPEFFEMMKEEIEQGVAMKN